MRLLFVKHQLFFPTLVVDQDQFQRGMVSDEQGDSLVVLATRETLDSDRRGAVHITLTTHGLDDDTFAAAREDWWSWWSSQVDSPELAIN